MGDERERERGIVELEGEDEIGKEGLVQVGKGRGGAGARPEGKAARGGRREGGVGREKDEEGW